VGKQQLSWKVHLANVSSALNRKWWYKNRLHD